MQALGFASEFLDFLREQGEATHFSLGVMATAGKGHHTFDENRFLNADHVVAMYDEVHSDLRKIAHKAHADVKVHAFSKLGEHWKENLLRRLKAH